MLSLLRSESDPLLEALLMVRKGKSDFFFPKIYKFKNEKKNCVQISHNNINNSIDVVPQCTL